MLELSIPGFNDHLSIQHLVLDFNGTMAIDGKLIDGVKDLLVSLGEEFTIHIVTGDSYGSATRELHGLPCQIVLLPRENQAEAKQQYVTDLNPQTVISIGNERNDCLMLKSSAIGILVIQDEGASAQALAMADIVCNSIFDAIAMVQNPLRLVAALRQ